MSSSMTGRSVMESPVLVLAEEYRPDGGQAVGLEQLQALLEGVVDVDSTARSNNDDAASPATVSKLISPLPFLWIR